MVYMYVSFQADFAGLCGKGTVKALIDIGGSKGE